MVRDFIFCLQEAALHFVFKKFSTPQNPAECFVNPPCGCSNPGKELQCEECTYLESCLSSFQLQGSYSYNSPYVTSHKPTAQKVNSSCKDGSMSEVKIGVNSRASSQ
jgi:hypothetical protein